VPVSLGSRSHAPRSLGRMAPWVRDHEVMCAARTSNVDHVSIRSGHEQADVTTAQYAGTVFSFQNFGVRVESCMGTTTTTHS
jgi:hypothetical protein